MRWLLSAVCAVLLWCAVSVEGQTMACESFDVEYRECRIGSSGPIRLLMEMSDKQCFQDLTWGSREIGVVWVRKGCRATFTIDKPSSAKPTLATRVVCESQKGNREACPADTSRGVFLTQQISKADCVEGESWGFDGERGLVWVDHGCRAEFALGETTATAPVAKTGGTSVVCESENGKRKSCPADTSAGVQIVRQLSDASCGYGHEWGYDAKGIWVSKGCRAEFVVGGKPKVMLGAVTCESRSNTRNRCAAETRYGVAIFRTLGGSECILDQSWGFDPEGIWVDAGCRAQFALGGYRLPADALPPNASKVTCESLDGGHKPCPVDTSHGVGLLRQISGTDCVLNRTWGYDRDGIWVTNGCRAEFAVAH
jgi:hypothetical protein